MELLGIRGVPVGMAQFFFFPEGSENPHRVICRDGTVNWFAAAK